MLVYFHLFTVEICWASSYLSPLNIIHQPVFMHHFDLVTPSAIWWFLCNHIHHQGLGLSWLMCQVCWSGFKRRLKEDWVWIWVSLFIINIVTSLVMRISSQNNPLDEYTMVLTGSLVFWCPCTYGWHPNNTLNSLLVLASGLDLHLYPRSKSILYEDASEDVLGSPSNMILQSWWWQFLTSLSNFLIMKGTPPPTNSHRHTDPNLWSA